MSKSIATIIIIKPRMNEDQVTVYVSNGKIPLKGKRIWKSNPRMPKRMATAILGITGSFLKSKKSSFETLKAAN